jgi:CheY-like chemotaxis protein
MNDPWRILVVEDDPVFAGALVNALRRRGYAAESAEDARVGLALAEVQVPDAAVGKGLQVPQLQRLRLLGEDRGRVVQTLRGLQLALGVDHLGAAVALGLGLARDGADHVLVEVDVLDLDIDDLDAPSVGLVVEDPLDVSVQALALGEQLVQIVLSEHRAQGGLGELAGGHLEFLDLDDRFFGVDHLEIEHRIDAHGDVVLGDQVLFGDIHGDHAQVDANELLDRRDDDDEPGSFDRLKTAEEEDHATLILGQDSDGRAEEQDDQSQREQEGQQCAVVGHGETPSDVDGRVVARGVSGATSSLLPLTASTRTDSPWRTGDRLVACHSSPSIWTCPVFSDGPPKSWRALPVSPTRCSVPTTDVLRRRP